MASDRTKVVIDGDASGVTAAAKEAEQSIEKLSSSVDSQNKNLNRYGEKLGAAFGPGQGLHGRLDSLETPLRDTEGAIARSQMAVLEFGNSGATAADKVGAGFLLAGDSIAAFTSGGVVGVAIAAAIAGFSLLASSIAEQEQASIEAEEATKKQAEALQNLAKSANAANVTISLLNAQAREKEVRERSRFVDQERRDIKARYHKLEEQHFKHLDELKELENANVLTGRGARKRQLETQTKADKAELKSLLSKFKSLDSEFSHSYKRISDARAEVEKEMRQNSENEITLLVSALDAKVDASTKAIAKKTLSAAKRASKSGGGVGEAEKAAEEARKRLASNEAQERQVAKDNRAFDRAEKEADAKWDEDQRKRSVKLEIEAAEARGAVERDRIASAERAKAAILAAHSAEVAAVNATTSALFSMAHDGELSFEKLADAAVTAAGRDLVASGTKHLLEGAATALAGYASGNLVAISAGTAEAGQGALMIGAGTAMGAVGGAIGRSGQTAAPSGASAPTDTRGSRAASSSGGGEGGTTVINFNGPAYDRRGVANVLTAGNRMARHRRVQGA